MRFLRIILLVIALSNVGSACANGDKMTSSDSSTEGSDGSCPHRDCRPDVACGERIPPPTAESSLEVSISEPELMKVDVPEDEVVQTGVLQTTVSVTNHSERPVLLSSKYARAWLANADSSMVVSDRMFGVVTAEVARIEVLPSQTHVIAAPGTGGDDLQSIAIGIDAESTCDGFDLPPGDYILMVGLVSVEESEPDSEGVVHSTVSTPIYAWFDVALE